MSQEQTIALIGTGIMGRRLLDAGFSLRVWNRSVSNMEPLVEGGAHLMAVIIEAYRSRRDGLEPE